MTPRSAPQVPLWSLLVPIAVAALLLLVASQQPDGRLHLWVLDVGQGDALLLRTPGGHTAVIDGGPEATPLNEGVGRRLPFWQRNLDFVVLTYPHQESITGLVDLLDHYKVAQVVQTEFTPTTQLQQAWASMIAQSRTVVRTARRGDVLNLDGEPEVKLDVRYPPALTGRSESHSIVLKVEYGAMSTLLPPNLSAEDETFLLSQSSEDELRSNILLVPRHGTDSALSTRFLEAVRPDLAIISVAANNRQNDPSPQILQALDEAGITIYRTDQDGTIEIIAEKDKLWIRTDR